MASYEFLVTVEAQLGPVPRDDPYGVPEGTPRTEAVYAWAALDAVCALRDAGNLDGFADLDGTARVTHVEPL